MFVSLKHWLDFYNQILISTITQLIWNHQHLPSARSFLIIQAVQQAKAIRLKAAISVAQLWALSHYHPAIDNQEIHIALRKLVCYLDWQPYCVCVCVWVCVLSVHHILKLNGNLKTYLYNWVRNMVINSSV